LRAKNQSNMSGSSSVIRRAILSRAQVPRGGVSRAERVRNVEAGASKRAQSIKYGMLVLLSTMSKSKLTRSDKNLSPSVWERHVVNLTLANPLSSKTPIVQRVKEGPDQEEPNRGLIPTVVFCNRLIPNGGAAT